MEGPFLGLRLFILAGLSIALILADVRLGWFDSAREFVGQIFAPVHWTMDAPQKAGDWAAETLRTRADLQQENEELRTRLLILEGKAQRMASLSAEVNRLRELLNASAIVDDSVLVAEIVGFNPDPYLHEVIIDKGGDVGVFRGQPVLDSNGLLGQVTDVERGRARVLLVTDSNHAVPVQVLRNGVRGVLVGSGALDRLFMINMPDTVDVQVGDQLVSSGLGERFPPGYPVAEVVQVEHDPGEAFARIIARPRAELTRSRHVLLVFKRSLESAGVPPAGDASP